MKEIVQGDELGSDSVGDRATSHREAVKAQVGGGGVRPTSEIGAPTQQQAPLRMAPGAQGAWCEEWVMPESGKGGRAGYKG